MSAVAWFDITTTNLERSRSFYQQLFRWEFSEVLGTDQALAINVKGKEVGTLRVVPGPISRSNGMVYLDVDDIQATYTAARGLGATVEFEGLWPMNLPDGKGAIAVLFDLENHPFGLFSKKPVK